MGRSGGSLRHVFGVPSMACPVGPAVVRSALVGGWGGGSRVNAVRPGREQPKLGRWVLAGSGPEGGLGPLSGGEPGVFRGAVAAPSCLYNGWCHPPSSVFDVLEGRALLTGPMAELIARAR